MSRMKQKYVLYSLSDVVVPVLVTEMKFGPRKLKILNLEKWYFRVRHRTLALFTLLINVWFVRADTILFVLMLSKAARNRHA